MLQQKDRVSVKGHVEQDFERGLGKSLRNGKRWKKKGGQERMLKEIKTQSLLRGMKYFKKTLSIHMTEAKGESR